MVFSGVEIRVRSKAGVKTYQGKFVKVSAATKGGGPSVRSASRSVVIEREEEAVSAEEEEEEEEEEEGKQGEAVMSDSEVHSSASVKFGLYLNFVL